MQTLRKVQLLLIWLYLRVLHRLVRNRVIKIDNLRILVAKGVFSPMGTITSKLLTRAVQREVRSHEVVLDLGTGTGLQSIVAALKGAYVVASDISPHAVKCAAFNMRANLVRDRVDLVVGDLLRPFRGGFDLIIFNPPYLPGKPRNILEQSWFYGGGEIIVAFLKEARRSLKPEGRILMTFSTISNERLLYRALTRYRWSWQKVAQARLPLERVYVLRIIR